MLLFVKLLVFAAEQVKPAIAVIAVEISVETTATPPLQQCTSTYSIMYNSRLFTNQAVLFYRLVVTQSFITIIDKLSSFRTTALNFAAKRCWSPIDLGEQSTEIETYLEEKKKELKWFDSTWVFAIFRQLAKYACFHQISPIGSTKVCHSEAWARELWKQPDGQEGFKRGLNNNDFLFLPQQICPLSTYLSSASLYFFLHRESRQV